jgi:uncharacterized membrane protein HdeD (DUF308 family)
MLQELARYWWLLLIRGLLWILLGCFAFFRPGLTLWALIVVYGVFALIDGVAGVVLGLKGRAGDRKWWQWLLIGLLGVAAGLMALIWPGITALALLFLIAFWAIVRGIFEIVAAVALRKLIDNEWWLVLSGVLSVAFGVLLLLRPGAGALAVIWLIGTFMLLAGILSVMLALRLRGLKRTLDVAPAVAR